MPRSFLYVPKVCTSVPGAVLVYMEDERAVLPAEYSARSFASRVALDNASSHKTPRRAVHVREYKICVLGAVYILHLVLCRRGSVAPW